ncbi:MAG: (2Fe-2S)-binding protein [Hyphomicrobiales bacterium]
MVKRIDTEDATRVQFTFDGERLEGVEGENLAGALLAANVSSTRASPVSGAPRAPFCMMGTCFECLVEIDGRQVQACMTQLEAGMVVSKPELPDDGDD